MSLSVDIEKTLGVFHLKVRFDADVGVLSLLGASGCGKSLTLKCIAGIERPDRGRITLNGVTLFDSARHIDLPPQKRRVGYLFQQYALFPNMTVRQNIRCGVRENRCTDGKDSLAPPGGGKPFRNARYYLYECGGSRDAGKDFPCPGRGGGEPAGVAADIGEFQEDVVEQFRGGRDVRGGEDDLEPFPFRVQVMVDEDLRGGGCLEGGLQPFRPGESVAVQQDDEVACCDPVQAGLRVRVVEQERQPVRDDGAYGRSGGVAEDTHGILLPAFPEVAHEGGRTAQRIPVRVRMGRDRKGRASFQEGV